jgi:putative membrane protein
VSAKDVAFAAMGPGYIITEEQRWMMALLLHWILSALSLLIVAHIVPGFEVRGFGVALLASLVIGLINSTLGLLLKLLTFPLTIITFGLFLFVINALMLRFAALIVPGFVVRGFLPAFLGAIVLALVQLALRGLVID